MDDLDRLWGRLTKDMMEIETLRRLEMLRDAPAEELAAYDLKLGRWKGGAASPWRLLCCLEDDGMSCADDMMCAIIYALAFGFSDWRVQIYRKGCFQLEKEGAGYAVRGDVMNAYAATAHAYLRMKGLEELRKDRPWHVAIVEDYDKFAPVCQGAFADFVKACHTVGNMLPIPSGKAAWTKEHGPMKGYADRYLKWVYEYISTAERPGDKLTRGVSFASELFDGLGELVEFLGGYQSWDGYVRQNYLEDFCQSYERDGEVHFTQPKPLWEGHLHAGSSVLPQSVEECEAYFKNATERILARGRRIVAAVKKTLADWESGGRSLEELARQMIKEGCTADLALPL